MVCMKKHPFLKVDYSTTVKLSAAEMKKIEQWLLIAGDVLEYLFKKKVIRSGRPSSLQISLLICGDARMRDLNRKHRNKDKITDVLSFPSHENLRDSPGVFSDIFIGDLAICHQQVKRQAKEFKIGYFDEFIHLFFHGVIHLLGYDHEISSQEEVEMQKWENLALEKFSKIK